MKYLFQVLSSFSGAGKVSHLGASCSLNKSRDGHSAKIRLSETNASTKGIYLLHRSGLGLALGCDHSLSQSGLEPPGKPGEADGNQAIYSSSPWKSFFHGRRTWKRMWDMDTLYVTKCDRQYSKAVPRALSLVIPSNCNLGTA